LGQLGRIIAHPIEKQGVNMPQKSEFQSSSRDESD
jgi:hypothetical protein